MSADFNHFPELAALLEPVLAEIVSETADEVQQSAQANAPVETGYLRDSITVEDGESSTEKVVVVGADYGVYVEFGTRHMTAEPYLTPAAEAAQAVFEEKLSELESRLTV